MTRRIAILLLCLTLAFACLTSCGDPQATLYDNFLEDMDFEGRCNEILYELEHGGKGYHIYGVLMTMRVDMENYRGNERIAAINADNIACIDLLLEALSANEEGSAELCAEKCLAAREVYRRGYRALQLYKNEQDDPKYTEGAENE